MSVLRELITRNTMMLLLWLLLISYYIQILHIYSFHFSDNGYFQNLQNFRQFGLLDVFRPEFYGHSKPIHDSYSELIQLPSHSNIVKDLVVHGGDVGFNTSFNDIFRFGSGRNDRFLSIFEQTDHLNAKSFVHFVGFETSLYKLYNYSAVFYCSFHDRPFPNLSLSQSDSTLTIVHERRLNGFDNEITCKIPKLKYSDGEPLLLSLVMVQRNSLPNISSFPDESDSKNVSAIHPARRSSLSILLPQVRLPRAGVSRTYHFNVSMSTMVSSLWDPLLVEWLLYHLLLGVEHFYLFDNSKQPCCMYDTASSLGSDCTCTYTQNRSDRIHLRLPPRMVSLMDAGLITIIPYHFSPSKGLHWNSVQRTTFQVLLQRFGHVNRWVGFNDIDEFFLPAREYRQEMLSRLRKIFQVGQPFPVGVMAEILDAVLKSHLRKAARNQSASGIIFSVQEMGCEDRRNYYLSPHPASSRVAVTLTCFHQGSLFREKHTKIFLRPQHCPYLRSPHTEQKAIKGHLISREEGLPSFSTESQGGLFLHYNRLKYSSNSKDVEWKKRKKKKKNNKSTITSNSQFLEMKQFVAEMLDAIGLKY